MRSPFPPGMRPAGFLAVTVLCSLPVLRAGPEAPATPRGSVSAGPGPPRLAAARPDGGCTAEEHRQFDFWRGSWRVHREGEVVGRNEIRTVADGCGLEESWRSAEGGTGTSLNYYDPSDGSWHQLWLGSGGLILHLTGGLEGGDMVMTGERTVEGETIRDRITWSPLPDGGVRQLWEISRDGGRSWSRAFDGRYLPE